MNRGRWIISKDFKLIACKVLKAGSTNVGRTLFTLDHLKTSTDANKLDRQTGILGAEIYRKFQNAASFERHFKSYTKFLFVREPIERLLSAYRAHLPHSMFNKNNYTFRTFLEEVAATPDNKSNPHVVSISRMCNPCKLKLDFIGSTDNYNEDMKTILQSVGAAKFITLPERNQTGYSKRQSSEALQKYLEDIPKSLLRTIYEKFYWDYFLFGFKKPVF